MNDPFSQEGNEDFSEIIKEILQEYVMTIPGNLHRSIFYMYVLREESPAQIAERYDMAEDEVIEVLMECQERARIIALEDFIDDDEQDD
tara:strand:+ start:733 stop:999 length:267 start_codon:yes stop_codon:yes gene_type:complete